MATYAELVAEMRKAVDAMGPAPPPLFTRFYARDLATIDALQTEIDRAWGSGPLKPPFRFHVATEGVLPNGVLAVCLASPPLGVPMGPEHMCIIKEDQP